MATHSGLTRKAHFLGAKIKSLRKRNRLTLDDLSVRCVQIDPESGPSVSYLSMIENGKRVPSQRVIELIAEIFQKDIDWFFDEQIEAESIRPQHNQVTPNSMPLEPAFLFSENLLQSAIPELLAQTGTTGRQFAHLLIRAHQESKQNRFPDLERAAESIGRKQMPVSADDLMRMAKKLGLHVRWFSQEAFKDKRNVPARLNIMVRSFFDAPDVVFLNRRLQDSPARLKYDLANHIAHKVLHGGDGARAPQVSGGRIFRIAARRPSLQASMPRTFCMPGATSNAVTSPQHCWRPRRRCGRRSRVIRTRSTWETSTS